MPRLALVGLLALAGCRTSAAVATPEPTPNPVGIDAPCTSDADCVVSTWGGCCAPCLPDGYVIQKAMLERARLTCTEVDCARAVPSCAPLEAPRSSAVCSAGHCRALRR